MYSNFDFTFLYIYFILAFGLSILLIFLSYFFIFQNLESEKISAYECGFQPFEDSRQKFDIHFYLVGILFIIFDLEIVFMFPWCVNIYLLDFTSFISGLYFLTILTVGFLYEWFNDALEWN
jgi:NADH:ubiquinone oxidoreductase subunit 3 (subunit A)